MSKLEVNAIEPQTGTTITIGASGDTVNLVGTLLNNGSSLPGDISSVVAGTGLSGGGSTGAVTINIEAAQPTITSLGTITSFRSTGIDDNSNALAMTIDSSERVGIGNTSPTGALDVKSGTQPQLKVATASPTASYNAGFLVTASNSATAGSRSVLLSLDADGGDGSGTDNLTIIKTGNGGDAFIRNQNNANLILGTNNSERMRITSAGDVFIGDSSPAYSSRLTVSGNGSTDTGLFMYDGNAGTFFEITTNAANGVVDLEANARSGSYPPLTFTTSSSERMRINSNGNIGIGTTSPSEKLHVEGSGTTNAIAKSTGSATAASVGAINNSGSQGKILMYGSGQGAYGSLGAGQMALYSNTAGMSIMNDNSSGAIKFSMQSGAEKMRIAAGGAVSIASSNVTQNAHLNVRQDSNGHAIRTYMSATVGSGALSSIKYIRAIPAVSAGTQLIIPFIAQNNINSKTYVHVRGLSCESNTRDPKAFECKFAVGHTNNLNNLTVLQTLGTCTGASISSMNMVLAFNTDYTHSGDSGMFIELDYIAHHQDASINLGGIVMN